MLRSKIFRYTIAALFLATTAQADLTPFNGSEEDLEKTLKKINGPVAILYTAPWIKKEGKDFVGDIEKYVEPGYRGKVKFLVIDIEKNRDIADKRIGLSQIQGEIPILDLLHPVHRSSDGSVKVVGLMGRVLSHSIMSMGMPDQPTTVPGIRLFVDSIVNPDPKFVVDFSGDPIIKNIDRQIRKLKKNIAVIKKALDTKDCRDTYSSIAAELVLARFEVRDKLQGKVAFDKERLRDMALDLKKIYIDLPEAVKKRHPGLEGGFSDTSPLVSDDALAGLLHDSEVPGVIAQRAEELRALIKSGVFGLSVDQAEFEFAKNESNRSIAPEALFGPGNPSPGSYNPGNDVFLPFITENCRNVLGLPPNYAVEDALKGQVECPGCIGLPLVGGSSEFKMMDAPGRY